MNFNRKASEPATASQIVGLLNKWPGDDFNANFTGAWDRNKNNGARVTKINRGNGAEDAVFVDGLDGVKAIYIGDFSVDSYPDESTMLCFYCDEAWFFDLH